MPATTKVSKRKMKRHEDGKRAASIGVEQFDEIYISTYGNAIKEGDLRGLEREGKKEGERGRERGRERERERKRDGTHVKKKILEKEEKIFP